VIRREALRGKARGIVLIPETGNLPRNLILPDVVWHPLADYGHRYYHSGYYRWHGGWRYFAGGYNPWWLLPIPVPYPYYGGYGPGYGYGYGPGYGYGY
jgi:hypothetical protein